MYDSVNNDKPIKCDFMLIRSFIFTTHRYRIVISNYWKFLAGALFIAFNLNSIR